MAKELRSADFTSLAGWVKANGPDAVLQLQQPQARALLEEYKRLRQSSDLLRKQNRKLRVRLAGPGAAGAPDQEDQQEV